jgi:hypothetical protein
MSERRTVGGMPFAGMAAAGVVAGHWLAYLLAVPVSAERAHVLAASGHGYWSLAIKAAVVLAVLSLGTVLLRRLSGRLLGDEPVSERPSRVALRLALLQVAAFTAMEATERLVAGAPVAGMFAHHVFVLGLALQILAAAAGALVLLWFGRFAERIAEILARVRFPRRRPALAVPIRLATTPAHALRGAAGVRGPPRA